MFKIGPYTIDSRTILAPMAGVTDAPFRRLCRENGAGLATSEMVTSDTRLWESNKTRSRLAGQATEIGPISIQIAGSEPEMMAKAAVTAVAVGAQLVDINMGCPAKKVCKKAAGSALLRDEALVDEILDAVISAVKVPVTLKIRTGWDTDNRNGVHIAQLAQTKGVQALAVHGRTRACRFNGEAEYDTIASIVDAVDIPVLANGDINSAAKATEVLNKTGADAVMIGRAALGNPWIFNEINSAIDSQTTFVQPSTTTVLNTLVRHLNELSSFYGETKGVRIARKHVRWYMERYPGSDTFLKKFNTLNTLTSQLEAVHRHFDGGLYRPATHEENAA